MGGSITRFSDAFTRTGASISLGMERHPVRTRAGLDGVMLLSVVLAFAQVWDPDVLFHIAWTVLALQAFTSVDLRATFSRIAFAFVCLVAYFLAPVWFTHMNLLEVAEWPLMLLISVIVAIMAERRRLTSRHYAELYRKTSDRLLTTQEVERKLLATDLHDGVGQALSSLAFTLEAAEQRLQGDDPLRHSIQMSRELVANAANETRVVAGRLQPARLAQRGLLGALSELGGHAGMPVQIDVDAGSESALAGLSSDVQIQLFRIAQESIANAVRHSGARRVVLSICLTDDSIALAIGDDGRGLNLELARDRGLGLAGMQDRANVIGALLSITSEIGRGTEIRASVTRPKTAAVALPMTARVRA